MKQSLEGVLRLPCCCGVEELNSEARGFNFPTPPHLSKTFHQNDDNFQLFASKSHSKASSMVDSTTTFEVDS